MRLASRATLLRLIAFHHHTTRSLAEKVTLELAKEQRRTRSTGKPIRCGKTTINELMRSKNTVRSEIAQAIETVLAVEPGVLFTARSSTAEVERSVDRSNGLLLESSAA
ncbi:hypothetical protein [Rhodococcoides fascians]|uniref:hypothetical protein n=1 Tax=Rhodococcoides fascians TaxID=1828 RepID=UPI00050C3C52|nr:hypothetical protein [Rhodococcus fascians]